MRDSQSIGSGGLVRPADIGPGIKACDHAFLGRVATRLIDEVKGDKVRVFKYKRRTGYHKMIGHRQKYTRVKITDIVTG